MRVLLADDQAKVRSARRLLLKHQSGIQILGKAVVALSGRPEARQAALDAGVDAFVSKGDPPELLLKAMDKCKNKNRM